MSIGLYRGIAKLADHDPEWEKIAAETIGRLRRVFGPIAKDIAHIGSTAIKGIKAKPIIDIAVAVDDLRQVGALTLAMEQEGFIAEFDSKDTEWCGFRLFADADHTIRTHNLHIVKTDGAKWREYLCFRDYMNAHPHIAKDYEALKLDLAKKSKNHSEYKHSKRDFIARILKDMQS